jgi:hypothetical protein
MRVNSRYRTVIAIGFAMVAALIHARAQQQRPMIPDKYTNLKLLPADITKQQLLKTMKGFSIDLGVRCSYCHEATDDLSQADFPADTKGNKQSARLMMEMMKSANEGYIQKMPQPATAVTCGTCHRGHAKLPVNDEAMLPAKAGTSSHP